MSDKRIVKLPARPVDKLGERLGRPQPEAMSTAWVAYSVIGAMETGLCVFAKRPQKLQRTVVEPATNTRHNLYDGLSGYMVRLPLADALAIRVMSPEAFPLEVVVTWDEEADA